MQEVLKDPFCIKTDDLQWVSLSHVKNAVERKISSTHTNYAQPQGTFNSSEHSSGQKTSLNTKNTSELYVEAGKSHQK